MSELQIGIDSEEKVVKYSLVILTGGPAERGDRRERGRPDGGGDQLPAAQRTDDLPARGREHPFPVLAQVKLQTERLSVLLHDRFCQKSISKNKAVVSSWHRNRFLLEVIVKPTSPGLSWIPL